MNQTNITNITSSVAYLEKIGFFQYLLPFFIFFLILFAILDRIKIVSKEKKINALIAFFIASFLLLYSYYNKGLQQFFMIFYAKMNVAILIFVFALTLAVFIYKGMHENGLIPEGKEWLWSSIIWLTSVFVMYEGFRNAPEPLGTWAKQVTNLIAIFAVIGAIIAPFISKK